MLISRSQLISGRPAVEMRDIVRLLQRTPHSTKALAQRVGIDERAAAARIADLLGEVLVEPVVHPPMYAVADDEDAVRVPALWGTTIGGNALAKARIGAPMARTKATAILDSLLGRVAMVNEDDQWLHWVTDVVLYGSLARPGDGPVGDVDVAVRLEPRHSHKNYVRLQDEMIVRDDARVGSIVAAVSYAQMKLLRHLRGGSSRIDLVEFDEARPLPAGAISVVVYRHIRSADRS